MDKKLQGYIDKLNSLNFKKMYEGDFFLTWEKTDDEIEAVFTVADALRYMRENNISTKVFESGLSVSLFRDNSTRTRFSFASACNLLGLEVQDLDEGKSQIAHGETVRETANMISFMADVIGIRDDMYIGKGNKYMHDVVDAVTQGHEAGVLEQKPTLVNLQCDIDHPTQCMADMLHILHTFGGAEKLKGKKIAMTWAYSPSYGKPLSVPQGVIGLMTRFGMDVVLAHPEGYEVMPEVAEVAKKNAEASGGSFSMTNSMEEAFRDADIVYPKSWAPFAAMEKRTNLYGEGDTEGSRKGPAWKRLSMQAPFLSYVVFNSVRADFTKRTRSIACFGFRHDLFRCAYAAAGCTDGTGFEYGVQITDTAGTLDAYGRGNGSTHELQVLNGAALGAVSGAGLDKVGTGFLGQPAGANLLLIREIAGFDDDLHNGTLFMGESCNLGNFGAHSVVIAMEQTADVNDHVQLLTAFFQGQAGFGDLDGGFMIAVREADDRAYPDIAAFEQLRHEGHIAGTCAHAGGVIFQCDFSTMADLIFRQVRLERGMVEHLGNIMRCKGHGKTSLII